MIRRQFLFVLTLCLLPTVDVVAQTNDVAYVTDVLYLGLHSAEDTSDRAFKSLQSGQQMTVLSRTNNYARVRLPDGEEGYVKVRFLVDEKPARLVVQQAQASLAEARAELASVRGEYSGSAARIESLETDLAAATDSVQTLQADVDRLSEENVAYEQKMRGFGFSLPWPIALGGILVALILGFAGGYWWLDSRSRKRHGGFRIY
ncbi:MAG: TIGR04211 family SH3 domain-containing protein [Pseudomonadota bacterium]